SPCVMVTNRLFGATTSLSPPGKGVEGARLLEKRPISSPNIFYVTLVQFKFFSSLLDCLVNRRSIYCTTQNMMSYSGVLNILPTLTLGTKLEYELPLDWPVQRHNGWPVRTAPAGRPVIFTTANRWLEEVSEKSANLTVQRLVASQYPGKRVAR